MARQGLAALVRHRGSAPITQSAAALARIAYLLLMTLAVLALVEPTEAIRVSLV